MPVQNTISKQRQIISLMSEIITEHIEGDLWYTLNWMELKTQLDVKTFLLYWDVLSCVRETAENDHKQTMWLFKTLTELVITELTNADHLVDCCICTSSKCAIPSTPFFSLHNTLVKNWTNWKDLWNLWQHIQNHKGVCGWMHKVDQRERNKNEWKTNIL